MFLFSNNILNVVSVVASSQSTSVHNAIAIHSNAEFTPANGVVSGSGNPTDPYIVENWVIDVSSSSVPVVFPSGVLTAGILIANTTVHVIIRQVQVYSLIPRWGVIGIALMNTTNVAVESSRVHDGNTGVSLFGASRSKIEFNEFFNLITPVGIAGVPPEGFVATGNIVSNNSIHDATLGIDLVQASDNLIVNNSIWHVAEWAGAIERGSFDNVFSGNTISNSTVGIEVLDTSLNNTISGNFFEVKAGVGVGYGANGTIVSYNEIHSLEWGITLVDVSQSKISRNTIQAGQIGINLLYYTTMNSITGNQINAPVGIFVCYTELGSNHIAPPPNDFRASDRPIERCH
jgi:parallel beta-helix repeat protein